MTDLAIDTDQEAPAFVSASSEALAAIERVRELRAGIRKEAAARPAPAVPKPAPEPEDKPEPGVAEFVAEVRRCKDSTLVKLSLEDMEAVEAVAEHQAAFQCAVARAHEIMRCGIRPSWSEVMALRPFDRLAVVEAAGALARA